MFHSKVTFNLDSEDDVFSHIVNVNVSMMQVRNVTDNSSTISRHAKLNRILDYEKKDCYMTTSENDHWKSKSICDDCLNLVQKYELRHSRSRLQKSFKTVNRKTFITTSNLTTMFTRRRDRSRKTFSIRFETSSITSISLASNRRNSFTDQFATFTSSASIRRTSTVSSTQSASRRRERSRKTFTIKLDRSLKL